MHVVVMGVSSTGKSAVAEGLAHALGARFVEGDDHHSEQNLAKMGAGVPLTDEDRRPWLEALAAILAEHQAAGRPVVLTCSALRRAYRDILRSRVPEGSVFFVHLDADVAVLRDRMTLRTEHFMPTSLLQSQLDTLEPLETDEHGVRVDVAPPVEEVVRTVVGAVRSAGWSADSAGQTVQLDEP